MTVNQVLDLIAPAFTIALLGAIESLLSASAADNLARTRHHSNQELIGQGLANIVAPLFGGFAATGAIARTAANIRNGGNSPIAAIAHSIVLLFIILLFSSLAAYIPLCTLAAILFVVAYNMSDFPHFIRIIKNAPRYDVAVLLATFLLTIFVDLVVAVNVGVILAMLFFILRMSQSVTVEEQTLEDLKNELSRNDFIHLPKDSIVYAIHGPFFFGVTEKIERALAVSSHTPKTIIFRLKDVPFMDMTGLETFHDLIEQYYQQGIKIYLYEVNKRVMRKFTDNGILRWVENINLFDSSEEMTQVNS